MAGWGLLVVAIFHLAPLLIDSLAWQRLFPEQPPSFFTLLWIRWIGESINDLLPVAQIGGNVVKARLVSMRGYSGHVAGATVVVDLTLAVFTQIIFTLLGVVLLLPHLGLHAVSQLLILGVVSVVLLVITFYYIQRQGLFSVMAKRLSHLVDGRKWGNFTENAEMLDANILAIYRRKSSVIKAVSYYMLGWLVGTGEVWLALYFLGIEISFSDALILESLGQGIRAAAFAIPGGLGVQEGGYLFLGTLIGLSPEIGLAVSLAKRVRELVLSLPGLIVWQIIEARQFRHKQRTKTMPISDQDIGVS